MEALEFMKEAQRMCKSYVDCKGCPSKNYACGLIRGMENYSDEYMRCVTKVVEQWSKEHPIKTNAQKFEEVFGFSPKLEFTCFYGTEGNKSEIRTIHWNKPYKEPEDG